MGSPFRGTFGHAIDKECIPRIPWDRNPCLKGGGPDHEDPEIGNPHPPGIGANRSRPSGPPGCSKLVSRFLPPSEHPGPSSRVSSRSLQRPLPDRFQPCFLAGSRGDQFDPSRQLCFEGRSLPDPRTGTSGPSGRNCFSGPEFVPIPWNGFPEDGKVARRGKIRCPVSRRENNVRLGAPVFCLRTFRTGMPDRGSGSSGCDPLYAKQRERACLVCRFCRRSKFFLFIREHSRRKRSGSYAFVERSRFSGTVVPKGFGGMFRISYQGHPWVREDVRERFFGLNVRHRDERPWPRKHAGNSGSWHRESAFQVKEKGSRARLVRKAGFENCPETARPRRTDRALLNRIVPAFS